MNNVINTKYTTFDLMFTLDEIKMIRASLIHYAFVGDYAKIYDELADKIRDKMLLAGVDLDKE